jgi:membrane protein implicated in regulation of membrane protease activity
MRRRRAMTGLLLLLASWSGPGMLLAGWIIMTYHPGSSLAVALMVAGIVVGGLATLLLIIANVRYRRMRGPQP